MTTIDERLFKVEVRMAAAEYLMANIYAAMFAQTDDPVREVKTANDTLRANLRRQTVPGADPAWSDHVAAEMQDAMERVLAMMEEMVACLTSGEAAAATTVNILAPHRPVNAQGSV